MRLFVFAHPRTASNLWLKLLESHPTLASDIDTPFIHAFKYGPERMQLRDQGADAENRFKEHSHETFQYCYDEMIKFISEAEQAGKIPMVKEHTFHLLDSGILAENADEIVHRIFPDFDGSTSKRRVVMNGRIVDEAGNAAEDEKSCPFLLPRSFVDTLTPVVIIRHPARYLPSYLRAGQSTGVTIDDEDIPVNSSMRWNKIAFEYFATEICKGDKSHPQYPIVIDGDDLCNATESVMEKFCDRIGIQKSGVKYRWDALPDEKFKEVRVADQDFLGTLLQSSGVVKTETNLGRPDIDTESKKWEANWGQAVATKIRAYVEGALDDYEYLGKQKM